MPLPLLKVCWHCCTTMKRSKKERKPDEIAYLKARVYNHLAQTYYATGRADAAILACQKAIQFSDSLVGKSHRPGKIYDSGYFEFFCEYPCEPCAGI